MKEESLFDRLSAYGKSDFYPFHMPGHKRNPLVMAEHFPGVDIDITEIEGFDNLHHPEEILKEAQERASALYGTKETLYSVNGSTAALLSAISAAVRRGGRILVARNCHKAVYHGIYLRNLLPVYVYPQWCRDLGINGGIRPEDVDNLLQKYPDIEAMVLTSPTYDGVVSDVKAISRILHERDIPLIVDEAHGAHFLFSEVFPESAINLGADVVIHSVHKTLPSLTQTALLHRVTDRIDGGLLKRFMGIYQSSSPSYVLMASIDQCITGLAANGEKWFSEYTQKLLETRKKLQKCKKIHLISPSVAGTYGIYDLDISKFVFSVDSSEITGVELHRILREVYHLEMEMETENTVLALTSVGDQKEGFDRLAEAILQLEQRLTNLDKEKKENRDYEKEAEWNHEPDHPLPVKKLSDALDLPVVRVPLEESVGKISGEFVYLYPPGIPLLTPGERISLQLAEDMRRYLKHGLKLQGMSDYHARTICVLSQEGFS